MDKFCKFYSVNENLILKTFLYFLSFSQFDLVLLHFSIPHFSWRQSCVCVCGKIIFKILTTRSISSLWRIALDTELAKSLNLGDSTCWIWRKIAHDCSLILKENLELKFSCHNIFYLNLPLVSRISSSFLRIKAKSWTIASERSSRRFKSTSNGFNFAASPN